MSKVGYLACSSGCERYRLCGNSCPLVKENVQKWVGQELDIVENPGDSREVFANNTDGKRIAYVTAGFITASVESK